MVGMTTRMFTHKGPRIGDAALQMPNCRKYNEHIGWEPEISFVQTMHDLLNYWFERVGKVEILLTR